MKTIAVLGSGLDWSAIYPQSHIKLAKEIIAGGGAIISEQNEFHKPRDYNFPQTNRIMAGLSHATLIIEANLNSNSFSQKNHNLEDCTPLEKRVYGALAEPMTRTDLLRYVGCDPKEMNITLSLLEMRGFICESGGILSQNS